MRWFCKYIIRPAMLIGTGLLFSELVAPIRFQREQPFHWLLSGVACVAGVVVGSFAYRRAESLIRNRRPAEK